MKMKEIELKCICGKPIELYLSYSTMRERICGAIYCRNCGLNYIEYGKLSFYADTHSQDEIKQDKEYIKNELIKKFGIYEENEDGKRD